MRHAREYERKIRKLLSGVGKSRPAVPSPDVDPVRILIESVLQADASRKQAEQTYEDLTKEFVDFNELRVAQPKEIVECMGRGFPGAREKAETLIRSLNAVFDRNGNIGLQYMANLARRDLRRHLLEIGLGPYAGAGVALLAFNVPAVPVDRSLVECLEMDHCVHPGSDLSKVQGFLERAVQQKDAPAVHEFFRKYVERNLKVLAKKHKADAAAAAVAQSQAKAARGAESRAAKAAQEAAEGEEAPDEAGELEPAPDDHSVQARAAKKDKPGAGRQAAKAVPPREPGPEGGHRSERKKK